jgi:hypothetical protein
MWQRFALDRLSSWTYYAGVSYALAACSTGPRPLAPDRLAPIDRATVRQWVSEFTPTEALRYDLSWLYQTQRGSVRGRAAVRLAPPDSIRFDYRGPFGRSGAAVVVGDSVLWAQPEDDVKQLIPIARLFWAALGVARVPPPGATLVGGTASNARIWRYVDGGEAVTYVASRGESRKLQLEMSVLDQVVGSVDVRLQENTNLPSRATIVFPRAATMFVITVEGIEPLSGIDPEIWREP